MNKFWKYILNKNLALLAFLLMLLSSCSSIIHQQSSKIVKVDSIVTIESDTTVALFSSYENPNCHLRFKLDVPVKAYSQKTVEAAELMIITLINEKYIHETSSLEEVIKTYFSTAKREKQAEEREGKIFFLAVGINDDILIIR